MNRFASWQDSVPAGRSPRQLARLTFAIWRQAGKSTSFCQLAHFASWQGFIASWQGSLCQLARLSSLAGNLRKCSDSMRGYFCSRGPLFPWPIRLSTFISFWNPSPCKPCGLWLRYLALGDVGTKASVLVSWLLAWACMRVACERPSIRSGRPAAA